MARALLVLPALLVALAACADDSGAPTPTPYPTPTPAGRAAVVYVLTQKQVPGYQRTVDIPLNPVALASENALPSLTNELSADGFLSGARTAYTPPTAGATLLPFSAVNSDAIVFGDAAGAARYFAAQTSRIDTAGTSATIARLSSLPRDHVDDLVGFRSAVPPPAGADVELAFIALFRTGRVVTQIFAQGTSASLTNVGAFLPLVRAQESLLAVTPGF